ncbi:MAG TPA: glycosyltransferase [Acidobacteriota bacterium]|nr:glycosyltransferase [Acidobacteriota bacterium]
MPWRVGVVTPLLPSGKVRRWDDRVRPLPDNVRVYPSLQSAVADCSWDWILAHNVNDLIDSRELRYPKVFLVHGTLSGRMLQDGLVDRAAYLSGVRSLLATYKCRVVYISALKERDWGLPGDVIRTAINPKHYGGYRGDCSAVLQVSNHLKERGAMLGWEIHREVCRDLPSLVLGENPNLPGSKVAESWEELKGYYRTYRVYLHTALFPYEDGYNLASLEAMATGMPIATMAHPTSPIEDGVHGVVAQDARELRSKVLELLEDSSKAAKMGSAARGRLEQLFPLPEFQNAWNRLARSL